MVLKEIDYVETFVENSWDEIVDVCSKIVGIVSMILYNCPK